MIEFIIKLLRNYGRKQPDKRRKRRKGNTMNQNGQHPQGMQGYNAAQRGYTTPQVPFTQGQEQGYTQQDGYPGYAGYGYSATGSQMPGQMTAGQTNMAQPMMGQGAAQPGSVNSPYGAPGGYTMPGYSMPPQQGNGGSFIPQTPYSPGYTSPGYQPPAGGYAPPQQGYPQQPMTGYQAPQGAYNSGYNPYSQMGRAPQQNPAPNGYSPDGMNNPIPLNTGGYIPPKMPVRRPKFEFRDWHLLVVGAVLIALFVLAVIVLKSPVLKIVLIILAAGSAGFLWVKPLVAENKRLTYSIVALALCVLTAVSFLMKSPQQDVTKNGTESQQVANNTQQDQQNAGQNGEVPEIPPSSVTSTPAPESVDTSLTDRLIYFFNLWSGNRQDEMLALCAPSWIAKQENPRTALFNIIANRFPLNCTLESITGTDADNSRQVTLTSDIDRKNGKKAEKYRMTVLMVKENNEWYVDPQSVKTNDIIETPDPNITEAPSPTPTAAVYADTILYYNPNGGKYYHFVADCTQISPKYLPLKGTFKYSEINDDKYKDLQPCNVCGAPLRP